MSNYDFNIAIVVHLYYTELWGEFSSRLKRLDQNFDLYITICNYDTTIINTILSEFPNANIRLVHNKGLDIGPFLLILQELLDRNIRYDFIIKLHTKKSLHHTYEEFGINWRNKLINALIGDAEKLKHTLNNLIDSEYGMATAEEYIFEEVNTEWMSDLLESLEFQLDDCIKFFPAGTMFIIKFDILKEYLKTIDISLLYQYTSEGYTRDGGIEHKLERLFGFIVQKSGYKILGINEYHVNSNT